MCDFDVFVLVFGEYGVVKGFGVVGVCVFVD